MYDWASRKWPPTNVEGVQWQGRSATTVTTVLLNMGEKMSYYRTQKKKIVSADGGKRGCEKGRTKGERRCDAVKGGIQC